jgi:hypothetical protein
MVGQGYFKVGETVSGMVRTGIFSGGRNCFREEGQGYFQVGETVSGMLKTEIFSGRRHFFRDGENREIFRWEKLFQGW